MCVKPPTLPEITLDEKPEEVRCIILFNTLHSTLLKMPQITLSHGLPDIY